LDQSLGKAQDFRRGRLTFNRSTDKVLWQYGPILKLYDDSRREKSSLGMPLSDVKDRDGHRLARYANGFITWSPDAGPHTVRGAFGVAYDELGRAQGVLGVAVGERERPETFPGGGRRQYFWEGALYENPSLDVVFELTGRIANRYLKLGEAASACGYPIAGMTADGDSVSADFEHGTITWTAAGEIAVECS